MCGVWDDVVGVIGAVGVRGAARADFNTDGAADEDDDDVDVRVGVVIPLKPGLANVADIGDKNPLAFVAECKAGRNNDLFGRTAAVGVAEDPGDAMIIGGAG